MDALHPFWFTPEVLAAAAEGRYGQLARTVREARALTLAQVAEVCHLSISALSRMETGERSLVDIRYLRALSNALEIPAHLFGLAPAGTGAAAPQNCAGMVTVGVTTSGEVDGDEAMRRRQVLAGLLGVTITGALPRVAGAAPAAEESLEALLLAKAQVPAVPVPLVSLYEALTKAQQAFERCEYAELSAALPRLIATAHASHDAAAGQLRERMSAALSHAYLLGSELAVKKHRGTVARVTADRSHHHAEASGDPLTIAASARAVAISMRRDALATPDRLDRDAGLSGAIGMLTTTALNLGADHGTPHAPVLAAYGSLLCTASYSAAQSGNPAQAISLIEEAEHAAGRLAPGTTAGTGNTHLSEASVAVYRISVHNALGDPARALSFFDTVDPRKLPTAERRARCFIDGARAWKDHGNLDKATTALSQAFDCAPQELQRPSVSALIDSMLSTGGRIPAALPTLASRVRS
ncbi:helix-turn-helix domain-containing protein [Amycolatopsis keratiniphila]|uniref:helix-turn-helix domain-containing protein n=1 Tax=Amycolatopsis keratiniphila TaxID=129921 RepID=UPI00087AAB2B|nr:helix-turn-helix transcriptional regulator [Amycolatopsis keratiniphila]OLZ50322.1 hypothetical protein BS330_29115 [Amycolatopsis keratiniphila subsp. nogabecina]SDU67324.1 Helix-turn-helix domain-containing protein [Amycolatopsis keratiniphila]